MDGKQIFMQPPKGSSHTASTGGGAAAGLDANGSKRQIDPTLAPLRAAVYFGSFDPVHEGHAHLIEFALNQLHYEVVAIVPNSDNPYKPYLSSVKDRVSLLQARFEDDKRVRVEVFPDVIANWQGRGVICNQVRQLLERELDSGKIVVGEEAGGKGKEGQAGGDQEGGQAASASASSASSSSASSAAAAASAADHHNDDEDDVDDDDDDDDKEEKKSNNKTRGARAVTVHQLIGEDSVQLLLQAPEEACKSVTQNPERKIIIFPREGEAAAQIPAALKGVVQVAAGYRDHAKISSTAIRRSLCFGEDVAGVGVQAGFLDASLHQRVRERIAQLQMYRIVPVAKDKMFVCVRGGPASGKGTLCSYLRDACGYCPISCGDIYRTAMVSWFIVFFFCFFFFQLVLWCGVIFVEKFLMYRLS